MTAHYVDTSALLRFVLEGDVALGNRLRRAQRLFTSVITLIEGDRAIQRAFANHRLDRRALSEARAKLRAYRASLDFQTISDAVVQRARESFPVEPLRTLDAIHLATAVEWHERIEAVVVISTDERVRANATALGLETVPARPEMRSPYGTRKRTGRK